MLVEVTTLVGIVAISPAAVKLRTLVVYLACHSLFPKKKSLRTYHFTCQEITHNCSASFYPRKQHERGLENTLQTSNWQQVKIVTTLPTLPTREFLVVGPTGSVFIAVKYIYLALCLPSDALEDSVGGL